jgi:hypothetical protein
VIKWFCVLCLGLFFSVNVTAKTVTDLLSSGQLTVTVKIVADDSEVSGSFIVGQAITVAVEVLTPYWFSKGSRIEYFDFKDVVIPPSSELAINGSEVINGDTWVSQLREITFYPTKARQYTFPALDVFVSVKTDAEVIEGVVTTNPFVFDVMLPRALEGKYDFVVSPAFELAIDSDFEEGKKYRVGDAITEKFTLVAEGFPAMMIPAVTLDDIDGLSIYRKPSEVSDTSTRGETKGTRVEHFTYIFEKPGVYSLPQQTVYWWDLTDDSLKNVVVPARSWTVGSKRGISLWFFGEAKGLPAFVGLMLGVALCIVGLAWVARIYQPKLREIYGKCFRYNSYWVRKRKHKVFCEAIDNDQYSLAYQHLYEYYGLPFDHLSSLQSLFLERQTNSSELLSALNLLSTLAFGQSERNAQSSHVKKKLVCLLNADVQSAKRAIHTSLINEHPLF